MNINRRELKEINFDLLNARRTIEASLTDKYRELLAVDRQLSEAITMSDAMLIDGSTPNDVDLRVMREVAKLSDEWVGEYRKGVDYASLASTAIGATREAMEFMAGRKTKAAPVEYWPVEQS